MTDVCDCTMIQDMNPHDPIHCDCRIENCPRCSASFVRQLNVAELIKRKYVVCFKIATNEPNERQLLSFASWNASCGKWKDFKCFPVPSRDDIWVFIPGEEESLNHVVNPDATRFFQTHLPEADVGDEIRGPLFVFRKKDIHSDDVGVYFDFKHLDREEKQIFDISWLVKPDPLAYLNPFA